MSAVLVFDSLVSENKEAFLKEVRNIGARLEFDPNFLMAVMWKESGLNHRAVNKNGGATGLIQFMPATASGLNTSTAQLKAMSNVEQLYYVEKYFKPYKGKIHSYFDLYLITFFPAALSKPDDWFFATSKLSAEAIGKANPGINGGKPINKISFKNYLLRNIPSEYHKFLS